MAKHPEEKTPENHSPKGCFLMIQLSLENRARGISCLFVASVLLNVGATCAVGSLGHALQSHRAPTLDPTYGLPLPASFKQSCVDAPDWIWAATVGNHQSIYLRKKVKLTALPTAPILYVTADNYFATYINGHKVAWRNASAMDWSHVIRVPVKKYLHTGTNILAVRATNDGGPAGVILELLNGNKALVKTDGTWQLLSYPPQNNLWRTSQNLPHLTHAAVECRYGGGPWYYALSPWPVSYLYHLYFQPQRVEVLHGQEIFHGLRGLAENLTSANMASLRPGYRGMSLLAPSHQLNLVVSAVRGSVAPELLLSFGQEVAGRIQVRGIGGTVNIGTGESRGEALHQPWKGYHKLKLTAGKIRSTPYSAFRYATISFKGTGPIRINLLRLDFKYYPVVYRGAFDCCDPLLTKIWYTGAYTTHLCMQEDIWDAPKRDRLMYAGDLQVSGEVVNNVFLDHFLMEQTMRRLRREAQGGNPPAALPANDVNGIPGYSCAWICDLSDFYKHSGAIGYIRSQRTLLLSMLRYMKQAFNSKKLFDNSHKHLNFVDWAGKLHGNPNTPESDTATDLYTCLAVRRAVFLLRAMGDNIDARHWALWDKKIIQAARQYLVNPKTGTYTSLRQVNAMAIDSCVADAAQRRAIEARILGPDCESWKQIASPYYNNFVIFALGHLGLTDQALRFVKQYWGGMIEEGATTFWEGYDPSWPKHHFHRYLQADWLQGYFVSLCHGWSCGATNWLTQYVLGVNSTSGGFATAAIVPHLGTLQWVSGTVPTPHGNIVLHVRKMGSRESVRMSLPGGINATIGVTGRSVLINGQPTKLLKRGLRHCYVRLDHPDVWVIRGR